MRDRRRKAACRERSCNESADAERSVGAASGRGVLRYQRGRIFSHTPDT